MAGATLTVLTSTIRPWCFICVKKRKKTNQNTQQPKPLYSCNSSFYSYGFCCFSVSEKLKLFGFPFLKKQLHMENRLKNSEFKTTTSKGARKAGSSVGLEGNKQQTFLLAFTEAHTYQQIWFYTASEARALLLYLAFPLISLLWSWQLWLNGVDTEVAVEIVFERGIDFEQADWYSVATSWEWTQNSRPTWDNILSLQKLHRQTPTCFFSLQNWWDFFFFLNKVSNF